MKIEKNLRLALLNNLSADQRAELSKMITQFARTTKDYGMDLAAVDSDLSNSLSAANTAWSELVHVELPVTF